jgi:hypothetical protein
MHSLIEKHQQPGNPEQAGCSHLASQLANRVAKLPHHFFTHSPAASLFPVGMPLHHIASGCQLPAKTCFHAS